MILWKSGIIDYCRESVVSVITLFICISDVGKQKVKICRCVAEEFLRGQRGAAYPLSVQFKKADDTPMSLHSL